MVVHIHDYKCHPNAKMLAHGSGIWGAVLFQYVSGRNLLGDVCDVVTHLHLPPAKIMGNNGNFKQNLILLRTEVAGFIW